MVVIRCYQDLEQIGDPIIKGFIKEDLIQLWEGYGHGPLAEYHLNELGDYAYLENKEDAGDLSCLGYRGNFIEQLFEFIEKEGEVYKAVLIRDNDGGTAFYSREGTLDSETEAYLKKESERK